MSYEKIKFFLNSSLWRFTFSYSIVTTILGIVILFSIYRLTIYQQNEALMTTVNLGFQSLVSEANHTNSQQFSSSILERSNKSTSFIYSLKINQNLIGNLSQMPTGISEYPKLSRFPIVTSNHLDEASVKVVLGGYVITRHGKLLFGAYDENYKKNEIQFIRASTISLFLLFILSIIIGFTLSKKFLRKVQDIGKLSSKVIDGKFTERLLISDKNDEFDYIAIQINKMLEEIDNLISSISSVTNNIAHDLKTPINRIRNKLEEYVIDSHGIENRDWASELIEEIDDIISTFNSLLQLSRLENNVITLEKQHVNIYHICINVIELLNPLANEKKQKLVISTREDIPNVYVEKNLIFRAVYNLLENSIKYGYEETEITLELKSSNRMLLIEVYDYGPGIPYEMHEKVIEKSFRLAASRTTTGFGLGLSIVSAIMKAHSGTLGMENTVEGLKTTLALPTSYIP